MIEKILKLRDKGNKRSGNFDYGADVIPVLNFFNSLENKSEFIDTLENMLNSKDKEIRNYTVKLCIGFVVFKDIIK